MPESATRGAGPRVLLLLILFLLLAAVAAGLRSLIPPGGRGPGTAGPRPGPAAPGPSEPTGPPAAPSSEPPATPTVPGPPGGPLEALGRALAAGDEEGVRAAAASLRRLLRGDAAARARAAAVLLDPSAPAGLRQALALVFGTFGGAESDGILLEALRRFPGDAALCRCALLALGGTREPEEEDDVFDLGDRPWGAKGPGGLGITVRRGIADAAARAAATGFLGRDDPSLREAAARALRHSVAEGDVRDAFLGRIAVEGVDEVAEVLGEALAVRAGGTEDAADRREILATLLARAGDAGLDGFRFRMEDDLQRVPLDAGALRALEGLAAAGRDPGVRSFALTALAGAAARSGPGVQAAARSLLAGLLGSDPDPAARDLAARLLHRLPADAAAVGALAKAAREDAAWNVRFAAVETLAGCGDAPGAAEAVAAARADPDDRVAARARELAADPPRK